jgi:hypothetical protein
MLASRYFQRVEPTKKSSVKKIIIREKMKEKLTNPVSTFGVTIIFDPFTMPFSFSVPSCSSLRVIIIMQLKF